MRIFRLTIISILLFIAVKGESMLTGNDIVIACPKCKFLAKYATILSGNTFGSTLWTDGKVDAPMLPEPPSVVECQHCKAVFWLKDALKVGEIKFQTKRDSTDYKWKFCKYVKEPDKEGYFRAIEQKLAKNKKDKKTLRILTWWRCNDPYRDFEKNNKISTVELDARSIDNMKKLMTLLGKRKISDKIMYAELLRELKSFDKAIAILKTIDDKEYSDFVDRLMKLCKSKDYFVRVLRND